ncbi:hypothetical protein CCZ01_05205 [Helicobacter monodelphidis]|uniref:hypothetical protein n=1 Tax=Helicobacter sp. 15-1451 TaxID=2004995 RepID=UPI000DCCA84B|nr:hypothetical protein [Helicobacter sp. 15-1451]RAX57686.1 hypothetical protein CCZ01_05205 [Helicobacter sp. 15-1451]
MKIAVMCDSPLLQKCLEYYLKDFIVSYRQCDFVIADKKVETTKPTCLVSSTDEANIKKPFNRTDLKLGIEAFFKSLRLKPSLKEIDIHHKDYALKCKIQNIVDTFADELYWAISEHYEEQ